MNRKLTIIVTLFCLALVAIAEYESKEVTGMNGNTGTADNPVKLTYNKFVDNYSISASVEEGSGWEIGDSEIAPSQHWLLCGSNTEAGGDATASEETSTAELFTVNLNGTLTKGGGGIGEAPKFFIQGVHEGDLVLEREKESVPLGESNSFTLKENGNSVNSAYWRYYLHNSTPPSWEQGTGTMSFDPDEDTQAGKYVVEARTDSSNDKDKKTTEFNHVGIASISGEGKTSTNNTGSNFTDAQTIVTLVAANGIQLTANIDPSSASWPNETPEWDEDCSGWLCFSSHLSPEKGQNVNLDTSIPHIFEVEAWCGNSEKYIKVVSCEVQVSHMAFNHDSSSTSSDGINLRTSYSGSDISVPEVTPSGGDKKALYKANANVTVKARFILEPAISINNFNISADTSGWSAGNLGLTSVSFSNGVSSGSTVNGTDGFVSFSPSSSTASTIKKETASFQWKLGSPLSSTQNLNNISGITIYTIWGTPQSPWTSTGNTKPWISALEFAIVTCGAGNKATCGSSSSISTDSMAAVTKFLHDRYSYPPDTQANYFSSNNFNYTNYIAKTDSTANCVDSAAGLSTTFFLLGISNAKMKIRYPFAPPFSFHCFVTTNSLSYVYDSTRGLFYAREPFDDYISKVDDTEETRTIDDYGNFGIE